MTPRSSSRSSCWERAVGLRRSQNLTVSWRCSALDAPITGGESSVCSGVPRVEIEASVVVVVPESLAGLGARVANARSAVARKAKPSLCSGSIVRKAWASRLTASQSYLEIASSASSRRRSIRRCSPSLAMMGNISFRRRGCLQVQGLATRIRNPCFPARRPPTLWPS